MASRRLTMALSAAKPLFRYLRIKGIGYAENRVPRPEADGHIETIQNQILGHLHAVGTNQVFQVGIPAGGRHGARINIHPINQEKNFPPAHDVLIDRIFCLLGHPLGRNNDQQFRPLGDGVYRLRAESGQVVKGFQDLADGPEISTQVVLFSLLLKKQYVSCPSSGVSKWHW